MYLRTINYAQNPVLLIKNANVADLDPERQKMGPENRKKLKFSSLFSWLEGWKLLLKLERSLRMYI